MKLKIVTYCGEAGPYHYVVDEDAPGGDQRDILATFRSRADAAHYIWQRYLEEEQKA
jgi:hypothetical protein